MSFNLKLFGISPAILCLTLAAFSGTAAHADKDFDFPGDMAFTPMTDAEFEQGMKAAIAGARRKVASSGKELNEGSLSKELRDFRDKKILTLKSPAQIDALIAEVNANFDKYPEDLKLVATAISLLKPMKGFLYRAKPFVESTRTLHSAVLSSVRQNISFFHTFFPEAQWSAVLTYIGEPTKLARFDEEIDIQRYLASEVYPELTRAIKRVSGLSLNEPIVFDYKIIYGSASFQSPLDRYRTFSAPEKTALISQLHQAAGVVSFLLAYQWTDFLKVNSAIGTLYGVDGFKNIMDGGVQGAPARERVATIMKYDNFLKLRGEKGKASMRNAFNHLKEATRFYQYFWDSVKDRAPDYQAFLDPGSVTYKTREIPLALTTRVQLVKGPTIFASAITGETVTVDVPKFFSDPPSDLKAFLATKFNDGPRELSMNVGGEKMEYRNYLEGSPAGWNVGLYKKYITKGVAKDSDIPKAARIIGQSWGGDGLVQVILSTIL